MYFYHQLLFFCLDIELLTANSYNVTNYIHYISKKFVFVLNYQDIHKYNVNTKQQLVVKMDVECVNREIIN